MKLKDEFRKSHFTQQSVRSNFWFQLVPFSLNWLVRVVSDRSVRYNGKHLRSQRALEKTTSSPVSSWKRDLHFTWSSEPYDCPAACSAKGVPSFLSYFKAQSNSPASGEPSTSRSAVKRSSDYSQSTHCSIIFLSLRNGTKHGAKLSFCNCQGFCPPLLALSFKFTALLRTPDTWCRKPSIIHQLHSVPVNSNQRNKVFKSSENQRK